MATFRAAVTSGAASLTAVLLTSMTYDPLAYPQYLLTACSEALCLPRC